MGDRKTIMDLEMRWILEGIFKMVDTKLYAIDSGMDETDLNTIQHEVSEMLSEFLKGEFRGLPLEVYKWDTEEMTCPNCQASWEDVFEENSENTEATHAMVFTKMDVTIRACKCGLKFYWCEGGLGFYQIPTNVLDYMGEYDNFGDDENTDETLCDSCKVEGCTHDRDFGDDCPYYEGDEKTE